MVPCSGRAVSINEAQLRVMVGQINKAHHSILEKDMEIINFLKFWYRYRALGWYRCWQERRAFKKLVKLYYENEMDLAWLKIKETHEILEWFKRAGKNKEQQCKLQK